MEEILKDYRNWLKIEAKGIKNVGELELATIVYNTAHAEVGDRISPDDILCAQLFENDWIVYCSGQVAKARILSVNTITVHGQTFQLAEYSLNSIRISIHGIPLHITDSEVETWVDTFAIRVTDIQKHDVMKKAKGESCFKKLLSGHRFCYASSIFQDIPRFTTYEMANPMNPKELITAKITIYFNNQTINCKYCKEPDHKIDDCPIIAEKKAKTKCFSCSLYGHTSRDCPATKDTYAFNGMRNKLSNFYPCEIKYKNVIHKSNEHQYQWRKATFDERFDIADRISEANSAWEAKKLGDKVKSTPAWEANRARCMEECLLMKLEQCNDFKDELIKSGSKVLVESTKDCYWGSGLSKEDSLKTSPEGWPGTNTMGLILTKIRDNIQKDVPPSSIMTSPINVQKTVQGTQGPSADQSSETGAYSEPVYTDVTVPGHINNVNTPGPSNTSDTISKTMDPVQKVDDHESVDLNPSDHTTMESIGKDNEGVELVLNLLDEALVPGLSPEQLQKVKLYLEKKEQSSVSNDASPSLKRKVISPNSTEKPTKKEKNAKAKLSKSKSTGGIRQFLAGKKK